MRHIAIDPSMLGAKRPKPCACFDGEYTHYIAIDELVSVDNLFYASQFPVHAEPDTVIIEDGYSKFPKQTIGLAEARRRLEDAALRQGLRVIRVQASEWQAAMLGKGRRGKCKELSCASASRLTRREITDDNEADAVNLWYYIKDNAELYS